MFMTTKIALALGSLIGLVAAQSSCSPDTVSCHWSGSVDSCCSPKYGLVVLNLQWVPGYGPNDEFTIHGLWPDKCDGTYAPSNGCDSSRNLSNIASVIKSANGTLYNRMNTFWPSYKGDNNVFWSHEWNKHGTCVSTLRPTCYGDKYVKYQEIPEYFEKALDLRDEYDVYGALSLSGVIPGNTYNVNTFADAIQSRLGAQPKLNCTHSGTLSDVSLYFYVRGRDNYEITDSPTSGSCSGAVYYPKK
ncbi:Putative Ribonuclease T2 family protein [Rhizopus microsporus]|nr:Putative Ribonuclease T2 family protein [Rhizopus microsporus]